MSWNGWVTISDIVAMTGLSEDEVLRLPLGPCDRDGDGEPLFDEGTVNKALEERAAGEDEEDDAGDVDDEDDEPEATADDGWDLSE